MEDILYKMDPIKREKLISSGLLEFGNNTYEKASTNTIIKEAGISKGLLYHYFSSKESFYQYLVDFMFLRMTKGIIEKIDLTKADVLERIIVIAKYKLQLFKEYPGIINFAKMFYTGKNIEQIIALFDQYAPGFYHDCYQKNIDYSLFKEGIDIPKALNITQWTLEKFSEMNMKLWLETGVLNIQEMQNELYAYLDEFRKAFYK